MDVPLAINDIRIQHGFQGYTRKSSTFNRKAGVGGLSILSRSPDVVLNYVNHGYGFRNVFINQ